jgi:hypothetical protein
MKPDSSGYLPFGSATCAASLVVHQQRSAGLLYECLQLLPKLQQKKAERKRLSQRFGLGAFPSHGLSRRPSRLLSVPDDPL